MFGRTREVAMVSVYGIGGGGANLEDLRYQCVGDRAWLQLYALIGRCRQILPEQIPFDQEHC